MRVHEEELILRIEKKQEGRARDKGRAGINATFYIYSVNSDQRYLKFKSEEEMNFYTVTRVAS